MDTRGLLLWLESVAGGGAAGRFIVGMVEGSSVAQGEPHGSSIAEALRVGLGWCYNVVILSVACVVVGGLGAA